MISLNEVAAVLAMVGKLSGAYWYLLLSTAFLVFLSASFNMTLVGAWKWALFFVAIQTMLVLVFHHSSDAIYVQSFLPWTILVWFVPSFTLGIVAHHLVFKRWRYKPYTYSDRPAR
jgi:hypothetical protein